MITASMVKELRDKTGAGMMDCKKALTEADGDMTRAEELLREKGITKAEKKTGRIAAEGLVATYVTEDQKVGAIVEVNSETDFVSNNAEFQKFVNDITKIVAEKNPADVDSLLKEKYLDEDRTVDDVLKDKIYTIGEKLSIRRFTRYETTGLVGSYVHGNGKIAVLVDMAKGTPEVAKDVCMQVAAARPEYLNEKEVPEERLNKEKEILKAQAMNEGKPANIAEKIVLGRLGKFYSEICLLDQPFVKNGDEKVSDMLKANNAEVTRFVRYERGEGIEKKEENFAEEVMKQLK